MQVELHLLTTSSRWRFTSGRISIGRDPACDVAVPAERYPMVSREHAVLIIKDGKWHLADSGSTNGTWINDAKTTQAVLKDLDRVKLGKDGPELEVHLLEDQPSPETATTAVTPAVPAGAPTRIARAGTAAGTPTRIAGPAQRAAIGPAEPAPSKITGPSTFAPAGKGGASSGLSREDEEMIEQKLNSLKNLVYLLLAMVAVLLGVIIYQSQQIDKNRAELSDLRKQAQSAVAQFTPALDQRLNALDKRLDDVDARMKASEDHFMGRLNSDLPRMLDKYVDTKMKQLGNSATQIAQPEQK